MSHFQVTEKAYQQADGTQAVALLLRLRGEEYLTVADAAEAFGVATSNIREHIRQHGLVVRNPDNQELQELRALGVIPLKTTVVNLLPKATIIHLASVIGTPEAQAAIRQIIGDWVEGKSSHDYPGFDELLAKQQELELAMLCTNLTSDQVTTLQKEIYRCASRLGLKPGVINKEIKERFLPRGAVVGQRTWKEIPQAMFNQAMDFCMTWEPMQRR